MFGITKRIKELAGAMERLEARFRTMEEKEKRAAAERSALSETIRTSKAEGTRVATEVQASVSALSDTLRASKAEETRVAAEVQASVSALAETVRASGDAHSQSVERLSSEISALSAAVNRHDMAVEDLLDSWEELQAEQRSETEKLQTALTLELREDVKHLGEREEALLRLAMEAQDALFALKRAAEGAGDAAWQRQLSLMAEKLEAARKPAGFQCICETGAGVDYNVHEVAEVLNTDETELDGRVAEVYAAGYLYRGRVLRKARIAAWRQDGKEKKA